MMEDTEDQAGRVLEIQARCAEVITNAGDDGEHKIVVCTNETAVNLAKLVHEDIPWLIDELDIAEGVGDSALQLCDTYMDEIDKLKQTIEDIREVVGLRLEAAE